MHISKLNQFVKFLLRDINACSDVLKNGLFIMKTLDKHLFANKLILSLNQKIQYLKIKVGR